MCYIILCPYLGGNRGSTVLMTLLIFTITLIGDPNGKHVVIVDDLVQTGGTLIECTKVQ